MDRKNTHPSYRDGFLMRSEYRSVPTPSSEFVLQWGNRKRLRCMKVQPKNCSFNNDSNGSASVQRSMTRMDRRVVRSDLNNNNKGKHPNPTHKNTNRSSGCNSYPNLCQRGPSPPHRILRKTESSIGMKEHRELNGGVRSFVSPEGDKKLGSVASRNNHNRNKYNEHHHNSGSPDIAHDVSDPKAAAGAVWVPTLVLCLTNKEKEEDFLAIKGCKLPQRPKKRAKMVQRTLNLVSPGAWLCDLTLERYEVREKRVLKKRARGLKALGNMNSESE